MNLTDFIRFAHIIGLLSTQSPTETDVTESKDITNAPLSTISPIKTQSKLLCMMLPSTSIYKPNFDHTSKSCYYWPRNDYTDSTLVTGYSTDDYWSTPTFGSTKFDWWKWWTRKFSSTYNPYIKWDTGSTGTEASTSVTAYDYWSTPTFGFTKFDWWKWRTPKFSTTYNPYIKWDTGSTGTEASTSVTAYDHWSTPKFESTKSDWWKWWTRKFSSTYNPYIKWDTGITVTEISRHTGTPTEPATRIQSTTASPISSETPSSKTGVPPQIGEYKEINVIFGNNIFMNNHGFIQ